MPQLPTITITGKDYFIDRRLNELRNVDDPNDAIRFKHAIEMEILVICARQTNGLLA